MESAYAGMVLRHLRSDIRPLSEEDARTEVEMYECQLPTVNYGSVP
jgi:hypothetical protein